MGKWHRERERRKRMGERLERWRLRDKDMDRNILYKTKSRDKWLEWTKKSKERVRGRGVKNSLAIYSILKSSMPNIVLA